jgi:uncharacterized protein DUF397
MTKWRKSSRSNTSGGQCVEVASLDGNVGVRDSKSPSAGHLTLTPAAFKALTQRVRAEQV